nr:unnamed protein product [Callosobruchus analis]
MTFKAPLHRVSKFFQPIINISKTSNLPMPEVTSKSQKLMLELGIIHQATPGCFHFLPLGLRALEKLVKIVDNEMLMIGGQKILFSELTNTQLWKKSGRLNDAGPELFTLKDRHNHHYILSPTYEEVASNLISLLPPYPQKHFPLKLYQISNKFRDEMKPRFGLMRGREFLMKDMYSFDTDETSAKDTYNDICASYDRIFDKLDMECVKVLGDTGNIGGTLSHEYQFKAPIGEDCILSCNSCSFSANLEVCNERKCPKCGEESNVSIQNGIEAGSKEEQVTKDVPENLYKSLEDSIPSLKDNIVLDDRLSLTIGRRYLDAKRTGYRYIVVINEKSSGDKPLYEVNDTKETDRLYLSQEELVDYIRQNTKF